MVPPPFATYLPDSAYVKQPKPAPRQRPERHDDQTGPGGARESAYAAFDTYFTGNDGDNRASGIGHIGRGLMSADSDSDDSDDERPAQRTMATTKPPDKHRVLYEAATGVPNARSSERPAAHSAPRGASRIRTPHLNVVKQGATVVSPRGHTPHRMEPTTPPGIPTIRAMSTEPKGPPTPIPAAHLPLASPSPAHIRPIQPAFMQGQTTPNTYITVPGTPTTRTPQPLPPPQSPITPVFARPAKEGGIKFKEDVPIIRGDTEETLLPRGRGGKGDDFWRRFSMVAHEEEMSGSKKSAWLNKTENGTTRLATWVWCVGILILVAIGGAAGIGWYFTHNKPAHQPVAIGGSAGEKDIGESSSSSVGPTGAGPTSVRPTIVTAAPLPTDASTSNAKRYIDELVPRVAEALPLWNPIPQKHRRSFNTHLLH